MIFACCHPALAEDKQVALTLRTLGGLTTKEIAEAYLVAEATMAQRLVRAITKIRDAGIPFRVPSAEELGERQAAVLSVVYLIFNEGYFASSGDVLARTDLADSAIELGRLLKGLLPGDSEVMALLALMLLQNARVNARSSDDGEVVLLKDQDRSQWKQDETAEGRQLVAEHCRAKSWEETDWRTIVSLYDRLLPITRSPVVAMNRAVAVGQAFGTEAGLAAVGGLEKELDGFHAFHISRGELLRQSGDDAKARVEFDRALDLASNAAERRMIQRRLASLDHK